MVTGSDPKNNHMDKSPIQISVNLNGVANDIAHVTPKISKGTFGSEAYDVHNITEKLSRAGMGEQKQDMLAVKCTDVGSASTGTKGYSLSTHDIDAKIEVGGMNHTLDPNNYQSPDSSKKSQLSSLAVSTPPLLGYKKHGDEEDDSSVSSSNAATSGRSSRFKVTVGTAPTFMCTERAENRKEYYSRLEEKRQALEEERNRAEARAKEEQEAAIKQLRRNMNYRANPIPNFYNGGPPPKAELRKMPVTRAVSPKLGGRRKSCSDVAHGSTRDDDQAKGFGERGKTCGPAAARQRHSVGAPYRRGQHKYKWQL